MVVKSANRIRAFRIHSILSFGTRRPSPFGPWRERRPALIQFAHSPTINSVRSIAGELKRPSRRVVGLKLDIRLSTPRLPALWPLACETYHPESIRTIRSNSGDQTPSHASSSKVDSPCEHQLSSLTTVGAQPHLKTELMVAKCATRIRVVPFHIIRLSGICRLSPSGRWRERRPVQSRFATSPAIKSVCSIQVEFRPRHAVSLEIRLRSGFEFGDCRPSGRLHARRSTLSCFVPFV
jgi:hypothetical protein